MAYFSLKAYDADVFLSSFMGLQQAGDNVGTDIRYAVEAQNVETPYGVLQPMSAPVVLETGFQSRIETMARLYRRWYDGSGSKDWLVISMGGKLYYKHDGTQDSWLALPYPAGVSAYQSDVWSWAAYEINPAGSTAPVDVLLMSNAQDGMIMVVPPYTATVSSNSWTVRTIDTQGKKFGVIERYAERIWGGAIQDDPDMLMYSRPFNPEDWTISGPDEEPEDGAGDIQQPSWDGDSFNALKAFGNQLIAYKKNRVWRILGTDPGEYTFKEQYGGGTPFPNTIAVDVERIFSADRDGMSVYDGLSVTPYSREAIERLWATVNRSAMDQMCGVLFKERYYLSVPTGNSTVNNDMIVFNLRDRTILYYTGMYIESFLATEDTLYATSSNLPGKIISIPYDSWENGSASDKPVKWVTPWVDFGRKTINKGGFEVYFSPEISGENPVTFTFSVQTEKKTKTKTVTIQPNMAKPKQKRIRFGGTGRRYRLTIEVTNPPANTVWRFIGGIQMVVETDPD